ncbi:hypothetical protein ACIRQQ_38350 [Streptomyces fuscichromogenes]|uniref:hypothetical protein n=1 Tax=Streptomyces fuscichromogenes TaxID=1324013 RepID=UPI0037F1F4A4
MTTAFLCQGWPRGLAAVVRKVRAARREPGPLVLPTELAGRWQEQNPAAGRAVLGLPWAELDTGALSARSVRRIRAAGVTGFAAFRGDGTRLDRAAAVRAAARAGARELLLPDGRRVGRGVLLAALLGRTGPVTRPPELFDPVTGRALPRGGAFAGVDALGTLDVGPLGFLRIPGMVEPESLEPGARHRVVLLGGSVLYGLGQPDNSRTIPAALHRRMPDSEVLCFAAPGEWSRGESALLLYRLRHCRPDVAVSLSGWNDFNNLFAMSLVNGPGAEMLNWTFHDHQHFLRLHAPGEARNVGLPFARKPSVVRRLPLDSLAFPFSGAELRAGVWLENQALMAAACARDGIRFVCALQPHSLLHPALGEEFTRAWVQRHYDHPFTDRFTVFDDYAKTIDTVYDTYRDGLKRLAKEFPGAVFLDLSTVFAKETRPCMIDGVHPTAHGAALLGDALADAVAPDGAL